MSRNDQRDRPYPSTRHPHDYDIHGDNGSASPFERVNKKLTRDYGMTIYRVMIAAGMVALLWLNSQYVQRTEFNELKVDVIGIRQTLAIIAEQKDVIKDHEGRLRELEQARYRTLRNTQPTQNNP